MSTFEVLVTRIDSVYDHPDADRLSIVKIGGYEAITMKNEDGSHRFSNNEPIVYVPEDAVVPEILLRKYGFWDDEKNQGMLSGSKGNRVKARRLRGVLSQGLVWKIDNKSWDPESDTTVYRIYVDGKFIEFTEGENVAEKLGIDKYEPVIPASMSGKVFSGPGQFHYDIENIKKFPKLFDPDEEVIVTEKLHGTLMRITFVPGIFDEENAILVTELGSVFVTSKGLGSKGLFLTDWPENADNLYIRTVKEYDLATKVRALASLYENKQVSVLGEVLGSGVQDLSYGFKTPVFRAFDVHVADRGYLDYVSKIMSFMVCDIKHVPDLWMGKFSDMNLDELTNGKTTLNGGVHLREGVVITSTGDQTSRQVGNYRLRPILKSVSADYLTRKGGTELQ